MSTFDTTSGVPYQDPGITDDSSGGQLMSQDPRVAQQQAMAQRFQTLASQHPWMPPEVASGLATSGLQEDQLGSTAELLRQAATAAGQGISHVYSDPVLAKRPTTAQAVNDWLSQAVGPSPVSQVNIQITQQNLQRQGLAPPGVDANGVWTPAWQAAFKQAHQQAVNDQLGGNQFGGKPVGGVLSWLTSVLPKEAGNALIGFVKSIPHDVRQLAADSVAGIVDVGGVAATLATLGQGVNGQQVHRAMATAGGFVAGQTPGQFAQHFGGNADINKAGYGHVGGRLVEDIGTLFLLDGLAKAGAKVGESIATKSVAPEVAGSIASRAGQGFAATGPGRLAALDQLGLSEAYRGPGVIARTLGRTADLGGAQWMKNLPVLGRVGPWVADLNDADGLYYRARTLMATPYTYMPVRAAGTAVQAGGLLGAEARGIAAISNKADPNNPLSADIEQTRTLNAVDDALRNKVQLTVLGKKFSPAIDDLAFFLHAPHPGLTNAIVGKQAQDGMDALDRLFGPDSTISAQIERGTGIAPDKLGKAAGGDEEGMKRFWSNKVKQLAASHYADNVIAGMKADNPDFPAFGSTDYINTTRALEHQAYNDQGIMGRSISEVLTNTDELANRIRKETTGNNIDPLAYQRQGLKEFLPASKLMREVIVPNRDLLMGKVGVGDVGDATNGAAGGERFQLGLARNDTLTQDQAQATVKGFQARVDDMEARKQAFAQANEQASGFDTMSEGATKLLERTRTDLPTVTEYQQLDRELSQFMLDHFDIDATRMPHDLQSKIDELNNRSKLLAGPAVYNKDDLPQHLSNALDQLREMGYKPVIGQDIGHLYEDTPLLDVVSDGLTWKRKAAEAIGLSTEHIPTQTIGAYRYQSIRAELQKLVDAGMPLPPYYTVDTILHDLRDNNLLDYTQGSVKGAIQRLFGGMHERTVAEGVEAMRQLPENAGMSDANLRRTFEGRMHDEADMGLQLRDIPRKKIFKLLTKPRTDLPEVESGLSRLSRNKGLAPGAWNEGVAGQIAEPMATDLVGQYADPLKAANTVQDPKQFSTLTKSLLHDGFDQPLTLRYNPDTNQALLDDGYGRLQAAKEANLEHVPVQVKVDHNLKDGATFDGAIPPAGRLRSGDMVSPTRLFGDLGLDDTEAQALPHFTSDQADQIYRAIVKGSAKVPVRYMGISKMEDMFRASMGFAGDALPGQFGEAIANLPNRLIQLRNNLRFDLNPEFAIRRVAKTNLKLGIEGVTPTIDPVGKMIDGGTLQQDRALLDRLLPNQFAKQNEEIEHLLRNQDVFGLYSHRDYQAYAAGEWSRQGLADDEIKAKLGRTFSYGTYAGVEGRSAAERSMNFMFFPFSFDKTLYRNVGAYLLDRPAQLYVASAGLAAFDKFNKAYPNSPTSKAWIDKHLPAMEELLRLNAFAHGVSLGEPGGINAPLVNFFLPQLVSATSPNAGKTLKRVMPAYKEFGNVWKQLVEQGHIVGTEAGNLIDQYWKGQKVDPFTATRNPAETPYAQAVDGQKYFDQLQAGFKTYLDWNAKHAGNPDSQYKLPGDPKYGKYATSVVDKTLIRNMVHARYPGYDPSFSAELGIKDNQTVQNYTYSVAGTPAAGRVANLLDVAKRYRTYLQNGRYDANPQAAQQATMAIRQEATSLAEQDPGFLKVWDKVFAGSFGPLEAK